MSLNNESWAEFRHDVKKDINEVFSRLRNLEMNDAMYAERWKNLEVKMDELLHFFKSHDAQEMIKYNAMNNDIKYLTKFAYIATGIVMVISFLGMDNIRMFFTG